LECRSVRGTDIDLFLTGELENILDPNLEWFTI
jgi:hypothetical protein